MAVFPQNPASDMTGKMRPRWVGRQASWTVAMGPQPGPQTPRYWSNLRKTRENNRPPNTLTRSNLGYLGSILRICCYLTLNQ